MSKKLIAAALAMSLAASAVTPASASAKLVPPPVTYGSSSGAGATWIPFTVMGCASGIILAAMVANSRDNRELMAPEAWTCGLMFWFAQPRANARGR